MSQFGSSESSGSEAKDKKHEDSDLKSSPTKSSHSDKKSSIRGKLGKRHEDSD